MILWQYWLNWAQSISALMQNWKLCSNQWLERYFLKKYPKRYRYFYQNLYLIHFDTFWKTIPILWTAKFSELLLATELSEVWPKLSNIGNNCKLSVLYFVTKNSIRYGHFCKVYRYYTRYWKHIRYFRYDTDTILIVTGSNLWFGIDCFLNLLRMGQKFWGSGRVLSFCCNFMDRCALTSCPSGKSSWLHS